MTIDIATTIDAGVTVTAMPGAVLSFKGGASLTILGTFDAQGTSAGKVTRQPDAGAASFGGITIPAGGVLKMTYVAMTGAELQTQGTGTATITDSVMSHSPGDLLIMNGGNMTFMYSSVGVEPPATDTTHCDMHFRWHGQRHQGHALERQHVGLRRDVLQRLVRGLHVRHWFSNTTNVDPMQGVSGDFSNGYFQGTAPSGTGLIATNLSGTRLAACTGANDTVCGGPRP